MWSSRIFIPEKSRLGSIVQNGSTKNFEKKFFIQLSKIVVLDVFGLGLISLVPKKSHKNPKKIVFGMGWTLVSGSTWDYSGTGLDSQRLWKFNATRVFDKFPKKHFLKIVGLAVGDYDPEVPFFRDENPGRFFWSFLELCWPVKVSSNITAVRENMNSDRISHAVCREISILDERHHACLSAPNCRNVQYNLPRGEYQMTIFTSRIMISLRTTMQRTMDWPSLPIAPRIIPNPVLKVIKPSTFIPSFIT